MRNWLVGLLAVVILTACTDDERYYLDDRNDIVLNLVDKEWKSVVKESGKTFETVYFLRKNGTGYMHSKTTYSSGHTDEFTRNISWKFYTPNYKYLYIDYGFWEITYLNTTTLRGYEYSEDPVYTTGHVDRTFFEFGCSSEGEQ